MSRSLSVLGERWTLVVLRDALGGMTRFEQFRESIGLTPDVLSERLATLVSAGIMTRVAYQEPGRRSRFEYHLTPAGRELELVVGALQQWGDSHLPWSEGPTIRRQKTRGGTPVRVGFVDDRGREVPLDQVEAVHTESYPTR